MDDSVTSGIFYEYVFSGFVRMWRGASIDAGTSKTVYDL